MRLEQSSLQKVKIAVHTVQSFVIFIASCITISIFTKSTHGDGRTDWYFALCFLSIPALIYQVAVPMWSRSLRFAKVYAFAAIDIVYTIFWLSAFAAVAAWNRSGMLKGAADKKIDSGAANCTTFAYGSEGACRLAHVDTALGVIVFFLFIGTSTISVLYVLRLRRDPAAEDPWLTKGGSQPYSRTGGLEGGAASTDPVWDPDTAEIDNPYGHDDHDGAATDGDNDGYGAHGYDSHSGPDPGTNDEYALLHGTDTDEGRHPGRQVAWGQSAVPMPTVDTEYRGAYGSSYPEPSALSPSGQPSPLSPEGPPAYEEIPSRGPGRGGAGYSFSRPER